MTKTTAFLVAAGLAAALAATTASAQGLVTHSPPSERATQRTGIDPNYHPAAGGLIDPNERKADGTTIDPNIRKSVGALVPAVKPANAGGLIDPNFRKTEGGTIDPNERTTRGGPGKAGAERIGAIIEERK